VLSCLSSFQLWSLTPSTKDSLVDNIAEDAPEDSLARAYCKYLYLLLFQECFQYLITDADFILKRKKANEFEEIMKKIYSFIEVFFIV
jgi:hypothetical protein